MIESSQIEKLKIRIPYDELDFGSIDNYEAVLNQLLEDSTNIALSNLYPFSDWEEKELPKKYNNWRLRACIELYNYLGKEGIKAYSENGFSFSKLTDGISQSLLDELIPQVGVIMKEVDEDE